MADWRVKTVGGEGFEFTGTAQVSFPLSCKPATVLFDGGWGTAGAMAIQGGHNGVDDWITLHPSITADGGYEVLAPWPYLNFSFACLSANATLTVTVCSLKHGA